jgi:hypothetical protein
MDGSDDKSPALVSGAIPLKPANLEGSPSASTLTESLRIRQSRESQERSSDVTSAPSLVVEKAELHSLKRRGSNQHDGKEMLLRNYACSLSLSLSLSQFIF